MRYSPLEASSTICNEVIVIMSRSVVPCSVTHHATQSHKNIRFIVKACGSALFRLWTALRATLQRILESVFDAPTCQTGAGYSGFGVVNKLTQDGTSWGTNFDRSRFWIQPICEVNMISALVYSLLVNCCQLMQPPAPRKPQRKRRLHQSCLLQIECSRRVMSNQQFISMKRFL
jgi:hypothetical protein